MSEHLASYKVAWIIPAQSFSTLKKIDCARAKFLQDLALTLALKTFWAPLNFALILDFLKVAGNVQ